MKQNSTTGSTNWLGMQKEEELKSLDPQVKYWVRTYFVTSADG